MLRIDAFSVVLVTVYFFVYVMLLQFETTRAYGVVMLLFSPLLLCAMVYIILKYGKYDGPELGNSEFGYQDKLKD